MPQFITYLTLALQNISEMNQMLDGRPLNDAEVRRLAVVND